MPLNKETNHPFLSLPLYNFMVGKIAKDAAYCFELLLESAPYQNSSSMTTCVSFHHESKLNKTCKPVLENQGGTHK